MTQIKTFHEYELERAIQQDPDGQICSQCGAKNTYVDDVGFFYMHDKAICKECADRLNWTTAER